MAIAGAGKNCFVTQVVDGELKMSSRQTMSTKVTGDVDEIIERLGRGEKVHVSSIYPTPKHVKEQWALKMGRGE